mmetsp:Transcript_15571/g.39469  ORF Transcript_15571/g.39469 Transcript_15571/m.39469 type:complete len:325 (+) Transcript_15571:1133-2107(+)
MLLLAVPIHNPSHRRLPGVVRQLNILHLIRNVFQIDDLAPVPHARDAEGHVRAAVELLPGALEGHMMLLQLRQDLRWQQRLHIHVPPLVQHPLDRCLIQANRQVLADSHDVLLHLGSTRSQSSVLYLRRNHIQQVLRRLVIPVNSGQVVADRILVGPVGLRHRLPKIIILRIPLCRKDIRLVEHSPEPPREPDPLVGDLRADDLPDQAEPQDMQNIRDKSNHIHLVLIHVRPGKILHLLDLVRARIDLHGGDDNGGDVQERHRGNLNKAPTPGMIIRSPDVESQQPHGNGVQNQDHRQRGSQLGCRRKALILKLQVPNHEIRAR